jgi:phosphate transport system protein
VSSKPDINIGLVLTAIVIDIERIGDYTKNIAELAATLEEPFDALELKADVAVVEAIVDGMFVKVGTALRDSDEEGAREVMEAHASVSEIVEADILRLRHRKALKGRSSHAVTVAIYLRFLKRVSAHLKNVATSVVNPYHRIGFREKDTPLT